jgi:hypothetical protein
MLERQESGSQRGVDPDLCGNPGEDRIYWPTSLERQESGSDVVRQRSEIDLGRRKRVMDLRDDVRLPSCQRRRYRRYSHEDASSSK